VARLEITEETYTEILHDKEWGVDNVWRKRCY
jgi:hypothetical protein